MIDLDDNCCGLLHLSGLADQGLEGLIGEVYGEAHCENGYGYHWEPQHGLVSWSDNVRAGDGAKLAAYIKRHRLGVVIAGPIAFNPKHASKIRVWNWRVNWKAMKRWGAAKGLTQ